METNNTNVNKINGIFKITKIGMSHYILLDKNTRYILDIDENSILHVRLEKIKSKTVKCPRCKAYVYDYVNTDPHDCTVCGFEFLDINAEQITNDDLDGGEKKDRDDGRGEKEVNENE